MRFRGIRHHGLVWLTAVVFGLASLAPMVSRMLAAHDSTHAITAAIATDALAVSMASADAPSASPAGCLPADVPDDPAAAHAVHQADAERASRSHGAHQDQAGTAVDDPSGHAGHHPATDPSGAGHAHHLEHCALCLLMAKLGAPSSLAPPALEGTSAQAAPRPVIQAPPLSFRPLPPPSRAPPATPAASLV